jgi:hypothetical protein
MAKKYHSDKARETSDGGMIPSGQGKFANMPTEVVQKDWGLTQVGMPENLDDTIKGIDKQVGLDNAKKHAHMNPKKV